MKSTKKSQPTAYYLFFLISIQLLTTLSFAQMYNDIPVIGNISPDQMINKGESVVIYASDIIDMDNIARVWAVITYPADNENNSNKTLRQETIELKNSGSQLNRYEALYNDFNFFGTYYISIFACDWIGNISLPEFTRIIVGNIKKNKAIILASGDINNNLWPATLKSSKRACEALIKQGYLEEDMFIISSQEISGIDKKNVLPTLSNIRYAIKRWAADNTNNLIFYITGRVSNGRIVTADNEYIHVKDIYGWFHDLINGETPLSGNIIFIIDTPFSGKFIKPVSWPYKKNKIIVISSSKSYETAYSFTNGEMIFSKFFWHNIAFGATIIASFNEAKKVLFWEKIKQNPQLEANNNGIFNEEDDENTARINIGNKPFHAGKSPALSLDSDFQTIESTEFSITISSITSTNTIEEVFAIILKPEFNNRNDEFNEISYNPLTFDNVKKQYILFKENIKYSGYYKIAVHALDEFGLISPGKYVTVLSNKNLKDPYEDDNTYYTANDIYVSSYDIIDDAPLAFNHNQFHNFHNSLDVDFVRFYAKKDMKCQIRVKNVGNNCDPVIEIFDKDGITHLADVKNQPIDHFSYAHHEYAEWHSPDNGYYFAKISHYKKTDNFDNDTKYILAYFVNEQALNSWIKGIINPPINEFLLQTSLGIECKRIIKGTFIFDHPAGEFTITIIAKGFKTYFKDITVGSFYDRVLDLKTINLIPLPEAPKANFTATNISGADPLTVTFENISINSDSWIWNFGDGSDENYQKNPVHVYKKPGEYRVSLIASGEGGKHEMKMSDSIIVLWPKPAADFTMSDTSGTAPFKVNFFDKSKGEILSRQWDFGDTNISNELNPEHIYRIPNKNYNIILYVTGPGSSDSITKNIEIKWPPGEDPDNNEKCSSPIADFSAYPLQGTSPLFVSFFDHSKIQIPCQITDWLWDFGDGNTSSQSQPSHKYINSGLYSVSLKVAGKGGDDLKIIKDYITINEPSPFADFYANILSGIAPLKVRFYNTSNGLISDFLWDFGDGNTSTLENPEYIFSTPGLYNISMIAKGPGGTDKAFKEKYIDVAWPVPDVDFVASTTQGTAPLTVKFQDLSSPDLTTWKWNFGDNTSPGSSQNPVHTYTKPGLYSVLLFAANMGESNTIIKEDYIHVKNKPPTADFEYSVVQGIDEIIVYLTDKSYGNINQWDWDYGDGRYDTFITSSDSNMQVYTLTGTYSISLTVTGPGGSDTKTREHILTIEDPLIAQFSASTVNGYNPLTVSFYNQSKGDYSSSLWNFGDGNTSNLTEPVHIYKKPGKYDVSLTIYNNNNNDSKTINQMINVNEYIPVNADFYGVPTKGIAPLDVNFFETSSGDILNYYWNFGDNSSFTGKNPSHKYINPGSYTVTLKITSKNNESIKLRKDYIRVNYEAPKADFTISKNSGTVPFNVQFFNNSNGKIDSWLWNFGDGTISRDKNPDHIFEIPGTYTVSLTVYGPGGKDQKIFINCIEKVYPKIHADFFISSTIGTSPFNVGFKDLSVGLINEWHWNFGDNTFSNKQFPVKTYEHPGTYYVSLTVYGPDASDVKTYLKPVTVNKPIIDHLYKFYKMWPKQEQSWQFNYPSDIAIDKNNFVYITDAGNHMIYKFDSNGNLINSWGGKGLEYKKFNFPMAIAIDKNSNIYIADSGNHRIQKFTNDGVFIMSWGCNGFKQGQFLWPSDIAINNNGDIYITDERNHRIQKFNNKGEFLLFWGDKGNNNYEFNRPVSISIDSNDHVYILDQRNYRIQKFTALGDFICTLSFESITGSQEPSGIAIDSSNNVYAANAFNKSIFKFSINGELIKTWNYQSSNSIENREHKSFAILNDNIYIANLNQSTIDIFNLQQAYVKQWSSASNEKGKFRSPFGIAVDKNNYFYTSDYGNNRIQIFDADGIFIKEWGQFGTEPGQFKGPGAVAVNASGNIYIADTGNHRISVFLPNSDYLFQWGSFGSQPGNFKFPLSLSIDSNQMIYVADTQNHRIQKFSENGNFICEWGKRGVGICQFEYPSSIAIDENNEIYIADFGNQRIQIFTKNGIFKSQFTPTNTMFLPHSIFVKNQNIFASDISQNTIQKFSNTGKLISTIGGYGFEKGKLHFPSCLFVSSFGNIYVSDMKNNRIQAFKPINLKEVIIILQILTNNDQLYINDSYEDINGDEKLGIIEVIKILDIISSSEEIIFDSP